MSKSYKIPVSYFVPIRVAVDGHVEITAKDEADLLSKIKKLSEGKFEVNDDFEITDEMDNIQDVVRHNNTRQEVQSMTLRRDLSEEDIIGELEEYEVKN